MNSASSARAGARLTSEPPLLREKIDDIVVLTLNRPDARNTLSEAMLTALRHELAEIAVQRQIRTVVLAANGPAFSAGHDLKELSAHRSDADHGRAYTSATMESCSAM